MGSGAMVEEDGITSGFDEVAGALALHGRVRRACAEERDLRRRTRG